MKRQIIGLSICLVIFAGTASEALAQTTPKPANTKPLTTRAQRKVAPKADSTKTPVVAPSLKNDKNIADKMSQLLLPPSIDESLQQNNDEVQIGVKAGFSPCDLSIIGGVLQALGLCPHSLDLGGQTQVFADQARTLSISERPKNINPAPAAADPNFQGSNTEPPPQSNNTLAAEDVLTKGNEDLNTIDSSFGTNMGVYADEMPNFKQTTIGKNDLSLKGGKTFDQDKRVPDINQRCHQYNQAVFPKGIGPCADINNP